jgi:hypothetical protein
MVLQLKRGHANCSGTSTSSTFFVQVDYFRLVRHPPAILCKTRIDFGTLRAIRNANFLYNRALSDERTNSGRQRAGGVR